jgi:hypothetical protein
MDFSRPSIELLAHFDGPTAAAREPQGSQRLRGAGWVTKWAVALAVLCLSAGVLAEFGYSLAAEVQLARVAQAAVYEATLPRAGAHTVTELIQRRLAGKPALAQALQLSIQQNGVPVRGLLRRGEGDRVTVTLAMPAESALPMWLRAANFWRRDSQIVVRAERCMPRRYL